MNSCTRFVLQPISGVSPESVACHGAVYKRTRPRILHGCASPLWHTNCSKKEDGTPAVAIGHWSAVDATRLGKIPLTREDREETTNVSHLDEDADSVFRRALYHRDIRVCANEWEQWERERGQ